MFFQSLTTVQLLFLCTSWLFFALSMVLFIKKKVTLSLFLLFAGSLMLGFFMGMLDLYINYWDEQYHLLVAKNMIDHPFSPMLYKNTVIGYSYDCWVGNHIWLHKQPLFLWQMALSMKIFGVTPLAARIPSILMHALMVPLVYKMGKNLTGSMRVGFYGAFLFSVSNYILDTVSGYRTADHNDIAFLFYVTASIWAWTEYMRNRTWKWSVMIGLFAGAAVLNKWLPGILVFGGWGLALLFSKTDRIQIKYYFHILLAFVVTILVFLPWQIYTFIKFPKEALFEYNFNLLHFGKAIEGHTGDWKYHFNNLNLIYGEGDLMPWLLLIGFILLVIRVRDPRKRIFVLTSVIGVYGFYTLAATKMISFPIIVSAFAFLSLAILLDLLHRFLDKFISRPVFVQVFMAFIVLWFGWSTLKTKSIEDLHFRKEGYKAQKDKELLLFNDLLRQQPDTSYTFFNLPVFADVPFMFHKGVHAAYSNFPNSDQFAELKQEGVKFVIVDNNRDSIPSYILEDSTVKIIKSCY